MNEKLSQTLQILAGSQTESDADYVARRLNALGITAPPATLQLLAAHVLRKFAGESIPSIPPFLVDVVAALLEGGLDGMVLFAVTQTFFSKKGKAVRKLAHLGIGVEAALSLPAGSLTSCQAYLIVVRKQSFPQMFVAQLSLDSSTNHQIVLNFRDGKADGNLESGRFVDAEAFSGVTSLKLAEHLKQTECHFNLLLRQWQ